MRPRRPSLCVPLAVDDSGDSTDYDEGEITFAGTGAPFTADGDDVMPARAQHDARTTHARTRAHTHNAWTHCHISVCTGRISWSMATATA